MDVVEPTRPTDWEDYRTRLDQIVTREGVAQGMAFVPRPDDVIISPYAKSGTTWLQQIVHGLRTRGDMDFDDISRVIPWIETSTDLGIDLDAEQRAAPRAFKSHLAWDLVPKGGRYIVSLRDPKDALVSLFRFKEGWFFEPGAISIEELARREYYPTTDGRDYWHHLRSWWGERRNNRVLLLAFEEMKLDSAAVVRQVAGFLGIELDSELLELVVRQSSIEFMLAHIDRFDDLLMREQGERAAGLPVGSDSAKVRKGVVGEHRRELPPAIASEMDEIWREQVEAQLGFASYDDLRRGLRESRSSSQRR